MRIGIAAGVGILRNIILPRGLWSTIGIAIEEVVPIIDQLCADANLRPHLLNNRLHILAELALIGNVAQDQLDTVLIARAISIGVYPACLIQQPSCFFRI